MNITRRFIGGLVATVAFLGLAACGNQGGGAVGAGDMVLGSPNAKVKVVEYASLTCAHCAQFHETDFPRLKTEYIDTGKISYVMREYPAAGFSPPIAQAQFLLARCMATDAPRYYEVIGAMFKQFQATAQAFQTGQSREHLLQIAQSGGLSKEQFEACITNKAEIDRITKVMESGEKDFKIESTPSFVIDGQVVGVNTFDALKPLIDAKLGLPVAPTTAAPTEAPASPPAPAAPATPAPAAPAPAK